MNVRGRPLASASEQPVPELAHTRRPALSASRKGSLAQMQAPYETLACADDVAADAFDPDAAKTIYDFQVLDCHHELYELSKHTGSVVLICNVASECKYYTECGYTTLVKLYRKHHREGFVVLAFPSNEFGNGEPGNEDEIAENIAFMYPNIGAVDFPIMAKVDVNGNHELPLFGFLKRRIRGMLGQSAVRWNFTYFLVDQRGAPYARFAPGASMAEIDARIEELLHPTPPRAPVPLLQAADSPAAVEAAAAEDGVGASGVDGASSLDRHTGCTTPPLPGLIRIGPREGLMVLEDNKVNSDSFANRASSSMLDATTATMEGEDLLGIPTSLEATETEAEQLQ
ncbi:hypothetical protein GH5_05078 [Leishmania sp. Ghana 2012 LV757]|uniref:hypothetical protein n=1 Tax=Leishmania sp. Ghana 2012 LV757 TaxID=2803181 RepID=UPI001B6ABED5|nr:hypothetical protein GH5_05078 [Leishmania sp. Ghana 2012 LV757]